MSTASDLVTKLRTANVLPAAKVNYGVADGVEPPFLSVTDFNATTMCDTAGAAVQNTTFTLTHWATSVDAAETQAKAYHDALTAARPTPYSFDAFIENYKVEQADLYVFSVTANYSLTELVRP